MPQRLLHRGLDVVRRLSAIHRWEFLRRHPYYLEHWQKARDYSADPAGSPPEWAASVSILAESLGWWGGHYFDPRIDARREWAEGRLPAKVEYSCVMPLRYRDLARRLAELPDAMRLDLARILAGDRDAIRRSVAALEDQVWDEEVPAWVGIDMASGTRRGIHEDLDRIIKGWNPGEDIPERRRIDPAKLDAYLAAWDAREGFTEGRYDAALEQRFRAAAVTLREEIPTLQNRHRSAFFLITGHDYTPELWATLFLPLKLPARSAPWRRSKHRSESVPLGGAPEVIGDAPAGQSGGGDAEWNELEADIRTLIGMGRTDAEIVAELELRSDMAEKLVAYFRGRGEDSL
jgi:hypothetical protein